ncbi:MAG TPA: DUF116 domain-containing protein [candidate division Zixibacteria bacterium]|nr:DUF116 domain-containing protein [candidate division Zixibacteria bacterium]
MNNPAPTYCLDSTFRRRLREFTDEFISSGYDRFSREFNGLDRYIEQALKDDCGERLRRTPKVKYLLEMVSFQILDDLNREAFNTAPKTLLVIPDCLSLHNPDCLKEDGPFGDICRQCTPSCQANQMVALADRYNIPAVFSKRNLEQQLKHYRDELGDYGVIGVACINMLAAGMRSAAEVEVPARGVLLNFSGCEHWQNQPCASEFSMTWLEEILTEKYGKPHKTTDSR